MKSLDQVEARTVVNAANTPGDASNQFVISASGSYYLTGNLNGVAGKNGISVQASDVTIDLNGFVMQGGPSTSLIGIKVAGSPQNLVIRNGTLRAWGQ